jgi:hypothetical protein
MPTRWKVAVIIAYVLIIASFGMTYWNVRTINNKGRALRNWAATIPPWAEHTQEVHDHPTPPPVDHVQPPPDPPPFW